MSETKQGETMAVEVEMVAFMGGAIRTVDVPLQRWATAAGEIGTAMLGGKIPTGRTLGRLELVFYWGQNDHQPKPMCSVSVGDVIRLEGERYQVAAFGFAKL